MRLVLPGTDRTAANAAHILDSRPPGAPLDELGRDQADELARRLAGHPVRAVHASRAIRAQQTAAPVAAVHGLAVEVVDGVHEVSIGDLEGRSDEAAFETFFEVYDAWWRGELDARLPGGESALDLRARFLPAVERLVGAATATSCWSATVPRSGWRPPRCSATRSRPGTCPTPGWWCCAARSRAGRWRRGTRAEPVRKDVTGGGAPA